MIHYQEAIATAIASCIQQDMNRNGIRKLFNKLHLWLGLASGLVLFVVCLSGTIYTFRAEIERWIDSDKYYANVPMGAVMLSPDTIAAKAAIIGKGKVTSIVIPSDKDMNWQVSVKKTSPEKEKRAEQKPGGGRPKTFFVNPYTGDVEGEQGGSTSEFFATMMKLHRWLLMEDSVGRIVVGISTIIFVFLILSGLVIWFPAKIRLLKQALSIKTSANWKRINHDLHNTLGFYSFLVLLIMSLTGLCWSFEWYRDGLGDVLGAKVFKGRGEKPLPSTIPGEKPGKASLEQVVTETNKTFVYTGNLRLSIPENDTNAIVVTKSATGFFAVSGSDKAQFDQYTGALLKTEAFSDKPLNVQIADSIKPIHTGEIFGTFSKIIYFVVCLIATSLPVTGTFIWLNKMKKKNNPIRIRLAESERVA